MHKAKGLEADYVIVLGVIEAKLGFPTAMTDDPILETVVPEPEGYPNAEERRLFYVALTRAKREVYLLAESGPPSRFLRELLDDHYDVDCWGAEPNPERACPVCKLGHLIRRDAKSRVFYGCSNYPYCEHTRKPCPACDIGLIAKHRDGSGSRCEECGAEYEVCPGCDEGWLERRSGKFGPFFGCSTYPACRFTRKAFEL